ncbi:hypothetical protein WDU94_005513 [Cyamophila willieti]
MNCSKCTEQLLEEDRLTCSVCENNYHSTCVGIMETIFRKMKSKDLWRCLDCKNKKGETQLNKGGEDDKKSETPNQAQNTKATSSKLSKEETLLRSLFEEYTSKLTAKMNDIEACIQFTSKQYDDLNDTMEDMKTRMKTLETNQAKLDDRIDFLENRSRICNIEIRNVPETQGEDVVKIVNEIGRVMGIPASAEGDIQVAHRVDQKNKERGNRPIIVHMASRYLRNKWLTQYKNFNKTGARKRLTAKMINQNLADTPVYLNEHITVQKKLLLKDVKEAAKQANFKFVWVKDSYILVKKDENDRHVKKINSRIELEEFEKQLRRQTFTK